MPQQLPEKQAANKLVLLNWREWAESQIILIKSSMEVAWEMISVEVISVSIKELSYCVQSFIAEVSSGLLYTLIKVRVLSDGK